MSDTWYFAKAEKIRGPYSLAKLQSKLRGRDQKGIYVWCDGLVEWQPVAEMAEFHDKKSKRGTWSEIVALAVTALGLRWYVAGPGPPEWLSDGTTENGRGADVVSAPKIAGRNEQFCSAIREYLKGYAKSHT